ncbi:putative short-chain oxidoreductase [Penicillium brasilianum]|uniref:Putative short-chain oxidoreductase n=1 Tax=Penicillium brasilianum TaxID=104259 RepID=A0A1S9RS85_PENBI|nr:putative short-chain oxidoreductase [Penicillium brasilianum]
MAPQIWLITGTSSGFGSQFVKEVIARGDKVIATARNVERITHMRDLGAATLQLDVTASQDELNRKAEEAISIFGRVDILVNNAGYTQFGLLEENSHDQWFSQFNTNVFGTLNTTRAFLPHLRSNKAGVVVFVGSMVAWDGLPAVGAYCASKAAIHYAAESLSKELEPIGIKTLIVEPGAFRTELLNQASSSRSISKLEDYRVISQVVAKSFDDFNGNQPGNTVKGVQRIVDVVKGENEATGKPWPSSLPLGSDAVSVIRKKCEQTLRELEAWEDFAKSTDI